jgi:hypothetical protein
MLTASRSDLATVLEWLEERHGTKLMSIWLWSCTPYPVGAVTAEQLHQGLRIAADEEDLWAAVAQAEREMEAAMRQTPEVA